MPQPVEEPDKDNEAVKGPQFADGVKAAVPAVGARGHGGCGGSLVGRVGRANHTRDTHTGGGLGQTTNRAAVTSGARCGDRQRVAVDTGRQCAGLDVERVGRSRARHRRRGARGGTRKNVTRDHRDDAVGGGLRLGFVRLDFVGRRLRDGGRSQAESSREGERELHGLDPVRVFEIGWSDEQRARLS